MERHWKVTGVGDLDDVGSDVTKDDVAKVQDVLWQLDSEMVNRLTSPFKTWKATFPKVKESDFFFFYLLYTILFSRVENNEWLPKQRLETMLTPPEIHIAVLAIISEHVQCGPFWT